MWETMENAGGVGLAAPQVGRSLSLFVIDFTAEERAYKEGDPGSRMVFINAKIISYSAQTSVAGEGCLSIPGIYEEIERPEEITITYQDEHFRTHTALFAGSMARMIQHEYDHIEGKLLTDLVSPLRRKLLKGKLGKVAAGNIRTAYSMMFG